MNDVLIGARAMGKHALIASLLLATPAWGHGAASWIMEGELRDPVSHEWCCGAEDCEPVPSDMVSRVPDGFYLKHTGETIPESRAMDSKDGQFWRCRYLHGIDTGKTRCFFKTEPGM